jgi:hypothetical protein
MEIPSGQGPSAHHVITVSSQGPAVGSVSDLQRRRFERLVEQLRQELLVRRGVVLNADSVEDVAEWRKAARQAGRSLGIPVRTGVSSDGTKLWASEGP